MSDSDATKTYHINSDMSIESESTESSKPLHDIKYSATYFYKFWHDTKRDNFRRSFSCPELPIKKQFPHKCDRDDINVNENDYWENDINYKKLTPGYDEWGCLKMSYEEWLDINTTHSFDSETSHTNK